MDLVKGLKRSGRALHAPKLPRSAGIPDSLTTCTAARRVAFARFAALRSVDDSGRGLRRRTTSSARSRTGKIQAKTPQEVIKTTHYCNAATRKNHSLSTFFERQVQLYIVKPQRVGVHTYLFKDFTRKGRGYLPLILEKIRI